MPIRLFAVIVTRLLTITKLRERKAQYNYHPCIAVHEVCLTLFEIFVSQVHDPSLLMHIRKSELRIITTFYSSIEPDYHLQLHLNILNSNIP